MGKPSRPFSPALLAGQQRLLALRKARQVEDVQSVAVGDHGRFPTPDSNLNNQLPGHLGWDSPAVTAVLRTSRGVGKKGIKGETQFSILPALKPANSQTRKTIVLQTCKLYPDIALGMLRREQATTGRIWLLLRHIDNEGRGWLSFEETREKLTRKKSELRVCGWRQLRNLLNQGEGVFWERRNGRIWLRSIAKTGAALGVQRLNHQPIAIPLIALLQGMGQVRAHLYASFHSGRMGKDNKGSPIARDTIAQISHIHERTQRRYEKRAQVRKKHNFAIGPQNNALNNEETTWRHGRASFQFTDMEGRHGRKGATYTAWQLPNNYTGPHAKLPRGRQKRINRELADLFMKGMTGNDQETIDAAWQPKRYFENGRLAAKACTKSQNAVYWQNKRQCNHYQLWYVLDYQTKE